MEQLQPAPPGRQVRSEQESDGRAHQDETRNARLGQFQVVAGSRHEVTAPVCFIGRSAVT